MNPVTLCLTLALAQGYTPASPAPEATPRPLPNGPVLAVETTLGTFKIGLHQDKSPIGADNFLKYARAKHFDGTLFHRVMPGFMIQGGGLDAQMVEKPTRPPIRNEASNGLRNSRGTVAMARTDDPNSATSQFFINLKDNASLDFGIRGAGYAVIGEVIEGMDVVDKIAAVPTTTKRPHANVPVTPVVIKSVREVSAGPATPAGAAAAKPAVAPAAKPRPSPTPRP